MSTEAAAPRIVFGEYENSGPRHDYREGCIVSYFAAALTAPASILDAGCGNGSLGLRLAQSGYQVTGVDLSGLQVERARSKAPRAPAGNLKALVGSLTQLPFPDGSFAGAVSGEVLEHIPEDGAAIREIGRVLAPGAPLVATVPFDPKRWDASDDFHGHLRRYTKEHFRDLLTAGGFALERTFVWGFPLLGLYQRFVYLPWLARARVTPPIEVERSLIKRLASSAPVRAVLSSVFHIDDLFAPLERGIGLLAVARKIR